MQDPRNYKIMDAELNWVKLAAPVKNNFGTMVYEMQIATTNKEQAQEWKANHLNVKEKDGKFVVALKRNAFKKDGSEMGPVRVVDPGLNPVANVDQIGNGSRGNVILWQAPYDNFGSKGITSSISAVQVTHLEIFDRSTVTGFDKIKGSESVGEPANPEQLF